MNSNVRIMRIKLAVLILSLTVFAMPSVAVDVDRWIQDLKDPNPIVRDTGAGESLTQTVMDWQARGKAVRALGQLNNSDVEPLIQALKYEDRMIRASAAMALGHLGDARAVGPLIQTLKDDEDWLVRTSSAEALGKLNDTRAIEPLIKAFKDEDSGVRLYAAEALAELNDTGAVDLLIQALKDEDPEVRYYAARALGKLHDPRALEPLTQTLNDENPEVRAGAAVALGYLGDIRAVEPLIQVLKEDKSMQAQISASEALGKLNNTSNRTLAHMLSGESAPRGSRV